MSVLYYITYDNVWSLSKFPDIYEANLVNTGTNGKNRTDQNQILVAGGPGSLDKQITPLKKYCTGRMILDRKSRIQKWQVTKDNAWQKKKTSLVWANGPESKWSGRKTEFVLNVKGTCCWTVTGKNGITETYYPSTPKKEVQSSYFRKIVAKEC